MIGATEPLIVTISHRLGRDEAKRRLERGLDSVRGEIAKFVRTFDYGWTGYRLDFRVSVLLQTIVGRTEVHDDFVRVELALPRLLHMLAKTIAGHIEQHGTALLDKPPDKT